MDKVLTLKFSHGLAQAWLDRLVARHEGLFLSSRDRTKPFRDEWELSIDDTPVQDLPDHGS